MFVFAWEERPDAYPLVSKRKANGGEITVNLKAQNVKYTPFVTTFKQTDPGSDECAKHFVSILKSRKLNVEQARDVRSKLTTNWPEIPEEFEAEIAHDDGDAAM